MDAMPSSPPGTLETLEAESSAIPSRARGGRAASVPTQAAEPTVGAGQTGLRAGHRPLDPMELGRHQQRCARSCMGETCYVAVRTELNGRRLALAVEVAAHSTPVLASTWKAQGTALPVENAPRTA